MNCKIEINTPSKKAKIPLNTSLFPSEKSRVGESGLRNRKDIEMGTLQKGSLSERVLCVLEQVGMVTRQQLGAMLFYPNDQLYCEDRYTSHTKVLTKAVDRLQKNGYIEAVNAFGKQHLCLSARGQTYILENNLASKREYPLGSSKNARDQRAMLGHSSAVYAARSMRIFSLCSEKPSFAEFVELVQKYAFFSKRTQSKQKYTEEQIRDIFLSRGICYSRLEIRSAYKNAYENRLLKNASRRIGMIFKTDEVITLYEMEEKITALSVRAEQDFDAAIQETLQDFYWDKPKKSAYILANSLVYIPSLFHGYLDGVVPDGKKKTNSVTGTGVQRFKVDKLQGYDSIYLLPLRSAATTYRECVSSYSTADYQQDEKQFLQLRPDVKEPIVICRYPNLMQLRKFFLNGTPISIVGPNNPLMVDLLSRCMRTLLIAYYDIETGETVSFTHYNKRGYPLVGNTNSLDHSRKRTISADDFDFLSCERELLCSVSAPECDYPQTYFPTQSEFVPIITEDIQKSKAYTDDNNEVDVTTHDTYGDNDDYAVVDAIDMNGEIYKDGYEMVVDSECEEICEYGEDLEESLQETSSSLSPYQEQIQKISLRVSSDVKKYISSEQEDPFDYLNKNIRPYNL